MKNVMNMKKFANRMKQKVGGHGGGHGLFAKMNNSSRKSVNGTGSDQTVTRKSGSTRSGDNDLERKGSSESNEMPPMPMPMGGGDMSLMMEQLQAMSQRLADVRMQQGAVVDEKRKAVAAKEELEKEVAELKTKLAASDEALHAVKDQVVFQKVQEGARKLKEFKDINSNMKKLLQEVKASREETEEQLEYTTKMLEEMTTKFQNSEKARAEQQTLMQQKQAIQDDTHQKLQVALQQVETLQATCNRLENNFEETLAAARIEDERKKQAMKDEFTQKLKDANNAVEEGETERNGYLKKIGSLKKELKKMVGERNRYMEQHKQLTKEHFRISQELERKSRSLKDAMEALTMSM